MDFETARTKRMQALEEKRKRLEEMRKRKKEREKEREKEAEKPATAAKDDLNDLIDSLLSTPKSPEPAAAPETKAEQPASAAEAAAQDDGKEVRRRKPKLTVVKDVVAVVIPPKISESYEKGIQTEGPPLMLDAEIPAPPTTPGARHRRVGSRAATRKPAAAATAQLFSEENLAEFRQSVASLDTPISQLSLPPKQLSAEEKAEIVSSEKFKTFLEQNARIVERTLGEADVFDVLIDYSAAGDKMYGAHRGAELVIKKQFQAAATRDRPTMDIQWSPHNPELFLTAYGSKTSKGGLQHAVTYDNTDPEGILAIWSLADKDKPEYVFHAPSSLLSAKFHPYDSHLVVGGTYSGQILLWDLRTKLLPVQRTPLASAGHTHPVYSLSITGSSNAHELLSASTDGKLCQWNLALLDEPTVSTQLRAESKYTDGDGDAAAKPVFVTCFAYNQNEASRELVLGSESGIIYRTQRQSDILREKYDAHFGVVTAMQYHPMSTRMTRDLLLSASVDWTIKLWNLNANEEPLVVMQQPTYEYVSDVKWSPSHPSLFGTTDSAGEFALWNLSHSVQEPVMSGFKVSAHGLTKIAWKSDGRHVLVGDTAGTVSLVSIPDEIAKPKGDEERFFATLRGMAPAARPASATIDGSVLESKSSA